ncbi:hypothetical protein D3C86_1855940 [compost metagenome]
MHGGAVEAPGDHLHRLIAAQGTDADVPWQQVAVLLGEQQAVPVPQAIERQRLLEVPGGIQHELGQAFAARTHTTVAVRLEAQAARQRGANRADVELLAFDGRGGDDVLQQGIQFALHAEFAPHRSGHTEEAPLSLRTVA